METARIRHVRRRGKRVWRRGRKPVTRSARKLQEEIRADRREGEESVLGEMSDKPRTRGECRQACRPCPWVSCRFHLYLEVKSNGSLVYNFPGREVWELCETCALDVADRGEHDLISVGSWIGVTYERAQQIVLQAQDTLRQMGDRCGLAG